MTIRRLKLKKIIPYIKKLPLYFGLALIVVLLFALADYRYDLSGIDRYPTKEIFVHVWIAINVNSPGEYKRTMIATRLHFERNSQLFYEITNIKIQPILIGLDMNPNHRIMNMIGTNGYGDLSQAVEEFYQGFPVLFLIEKVIVLNNPNIVASADFSRRGMAVPYEIGANVFMHEMGHILGLNHPRFCAKSNLMRAEGVDQCANASFTRRQIGIMHHKINSKDWSVKTFGMKVIFGDTLPDHIPLVPMEIFSFDQLPAQNFPSRPRNLSPTLPRSISRSNGYDQIARIL